ncbi:MAG: hypothetical protein C4575_09365 [Desulforudis sp.]|nr:MAG: hypothetical protein C4575_09365 [Desulforudis sp.]
MTASINVAGRSYDTGYLAHRCGAEPGHPETRIADGVLYIGGVTQDVLDQVWASYDPEAAVTWREQEKAKLDLAASDTGTVRVVEDLVDALVAKGVISLDDLPAVAAAKLSTRKALRDRLV